MKVGLAIVERKGMQYLYADGDDYVFMDLDTYDQVHVGPEVMGDAGKYLVEGAEAQIAMHEGVPIARRPAGLDGARDHRDGARA